MSQSKLLNGMSSSHLATFIPPDMLPHLLTRQVPACPAPKSHTDVSVAKITILGIGSYGANVAELLAKNVAGIDCYEILFCQTGSDTEKITALISAVQESDLLFIITDFADPSSELLFDRFAAAASSKGSVTVGTLPGREDLKKYSPEYLQEWTKHVDTLFPISDNSVNQQQSFDEESTAQQPALVHAITTISNVITHDSMISVDFADIKAILQSGKIGRMGTGVASGSLRGATAAILALERLKDQQQKMEDITGALVCLEGSSLMTMDDYEDASRIIHEHLPDDSNILTGFLMGDQMGSNVRVTVLTVERL